MHEIRLNSEKCLVKQLIMFARIKNRVMTVVNPPELQSLPSNSSGNIGININNGGSNYNGYNRNLPDKFVYARPQFLQLLTFDELKASADHNVRPIIVPRDISVMPWCSGYAECVNSGKSEWNEDQAAFRREILSHPLKKFPDLPYIYFGIFDGHAGYGAALAASNQFHHILHEKLVDVLDNLLQDNDKKIQNVPVEKIQHSLLFHRNISKDELIIGALESAFVDMDAVLAEDRNKYRNAGGCTACVALFIFGKLFVANSGDSRGIVCHRMSPSSIKSNFNGDPRIKCEPIRNGNVESSSEELCVFPIPFSFDHTPDTERPRLMSVASLNPNLMGNDYIAMEYAKKPMGKDLGTRILYRCGTMKGWTYKTVTREDLKMPIVTGEGKRSRLLGTIGVTRGFGDHDLRALGSGLPIKPFLSAHPDVNYRDLTKIISISDDEHEEGDYGILVMATDGLWDVADNNTVSRVVFSTLDKYPNERHKYVMAAQELVAKSRGRINESGHWRLSDSKAAATVDDISVLVIPIYQYYKEFLEWEKSYHNHMTNGVIGEDESSTEEKISVPPCEPVIEVPTNSVSVDDKMIDNLSLIREVGEGEESVQSTVEPFGIAEVNKVTGTSETDNINNQKDNISESPSTEKSS